MTLSCLRAAVCSPPTAPARFDFEAQIVAARVIAAVLSTETLISDSHPFHSALEALLGVDAQKALVSAAGAEDTLTKFVSMLEEVEDASGREEEDKRQSDAEKRRGVGTIAETRRGAPH